MSRAVAVVLCLVAGLLVGVQPAANAALSRHVGDLGAAFVSLTVSTVLIGVLLVVAGHPERLAGIGSIRPEHLVGALGGAMVVAVSLAAVKPLGTGAVIALLVAAQLVSSVVADRMGWYGVQVVPISLGRVIGVLLVVGGTVLVTRG